MKIHTILLTAVALATSSLAGCNSASMANHDTDPSITTSATHRAITSGESVTITANTKNLSGGSEIKWSVLPEGSGIKITPDKDNNNKSALLTAQQPGTFTVRASADVGNGHWVSSDTTVIVNARPGSGMAYDH